MIRRLRSIPTFASPSLAVGTILLLIIAVGSSFGGLFYNTHLAAISSVPLSMPPSWDYPLGTQAEGRDVFAMLLIGTPNTLVIGLISGGIGMLVGVLLGMISGYFGGLVDGVIRNVVDVGLAIPPFAVLILVAAAFRVVSIEMMGVAVALTVWMYPARVIRSQVLSIRTRGYVRIAKLSGISDLRIVFGELMPNLLPILAAAIVNAIEVGILASIGLELLGLGGNDITLGTTIYFAIYYAAVWQGMWWWWLPPVVVLVVIFLGLFLVNAGIDAIINPKLRGNGT